MARTRLIGDQSPASVRVDVRVKFCDHPDVKALYEKNPQNFSRVTLDALSLYAYIVKRTGAVSLADAVGAIASRGDALDRPVELSRPAEKPVVKALVVEDSVVEKKAAAVGGLSASAASALLKLDEEM